MFLLMEPTTWHQDHKTASYGVISFQNSVMSYVITFFMQRLPVRLVGKYTTTTAFRAPLKQRNSMQSHAIMVVPIIKMKNWNFG